MTPLFEIDFIVPFHASKKNDKRAVMRGQRLMIMQGKRTAQVRDQITATFKRWLRANPDFKMIKSDINAQMIFRFPLTEFYTKAGQRKKTMIDLSNAYQIHEDCLQKAGIIENDGLICSHDGSAREPASTYSVRIIITKK